MNNDTVISLAKAGLGDGLIIDKIGSEPCGYSITTSDIISLKKAGISDNVISAMVRRCASLSSVRGVAGNDASNDPKMKHSPGIYIAETWAPSTPLQVLRPSKPSGMRTSGNGSVLLPLVAHMVVSGTTGHVAVPIGSPTFYFYFNPSDPNVSDFGSENSVAAQSPDEFSLVKFRIKGSDREVDFGRASAYGGALVSMRKGVNSKYTIKFDTEDLGNGIYRATASQPLEAGEYAFLFTGSNTTARIYDFSVTGLPNAAAKK